MNDFNLLNCDRDFCFICKELIISKEHYLMFSSYSGKSIHEIIGTIFSHILFVDDFFINKICAGCQQKIKIFDEFQTKANRIKDELTNLYESTEKLQEIEELEIENALNFHPIELEIINESDPTCANNMQESKTEEMEDLSEDFKKIIAENGIKYDYSVFQRVFGDNDDIEARGQHRKFYYCDECEIEIKTFNNYLIHKADHEKQQKSNEENATVNQIKPIEKYNCFCGKIFMYKLSYTQHLKIHLNIREYPCNLCDFKAFNSTHLKRHIRARHTKEKNHICVYCNRRFAEKYNMNSHIKKQHLSGSVQTIY